MAQFAAADVDAYAVVNILLAMTLFVVLARPQFHRRRKTA
jgi:hypothetical protein